MALDSAVPRWLAPLHARIDTQVQRLLQPDESPRVDFSRPRGEPALIAPDSVSWTVFRNPVTVFIGGVAAVVLELAEPRVRSGVWDHTSFRERPLERMARTGLAAMLTVYGPRSQTEAMIGRVNRLHDRVVGITPQGESYSARDPELLSWVHATASYGFLEAYCAWLHDLDMVQRDRYYAEGREVARLYGAVKVPGSQAQLQAMFDAWAPRLRASETVFEFLRITQQMPALPRALRPAQRWLVHAAVELVPQWLRARLGLGAGWGLAPWQRRGLRCMVAAVASLPLTGCPPAQACLRLGLPPDDLRRRASERASGSTGAR